MADIGRRRQLGGEEALIVVPVVRHHLQDEVGLARQHVALADMGPGAHQLLERLEVGLRLADQPDMGEDGDAESHRLGVDLGVIALYEAGLLQRPHPAQAGRRGNSGALGQIDVCHPAIGLQIGQDAKIDSVQFGAPHNRSPRFSVGLLKLYYPRNFPSPSDSARPSPGLCDGGINLCQAAPHLMLETCSKRIASDSLNGRHRP